MLKFAQDIKLSPEETRRNQTAQRDLDWWAENYNALWEKYRGQHIAILGERVVAAGSDVGEVQRQADEVQPDGRVPVVYMPRIIRKKIL